MIEVENELELIGHGVLAQEIPNGVVFWRAKPGRNFDDIDVHGVWKGKEKVLYVPIHDNPQKSRVIEFCRKKVKKALKIVAVENLEGVLA